MLRHPNSLHTFTALAQLQVYTPVSEPPHYGSLHIRITTLRMACISLWWDCVKSRTQSGYHTICAIMINSYTYASSHPENHPSTTLGPALRNCHCLAAFRSSLGYVKPSGSFSGQWLSPDGSSVPKCIRVRRRCFDLEIVSSDYLPVHRYLLTLPIVWRIYHDHWTNRRPMWAERFLVFDEH
jgi:hypothetical protein